MKSVDLKFYENDEGVSADLVLPAFGSEPVQCINLEADSADEKMKSDIEFLIEKQTYFFQKITVEAPVYCKQIY